MIRSLSVLCFALAILGVSPSASADVVEPGFVETCTLEQVQQAHPGETCIACNTYYAEATRCDTELSEGGYTQACRSRGASVWNQIGCRAGASPSVTPTPSPAPAVTPTPSPAPAETPTPAPTNPPATTPAAEPSSSRCSVGGAGNEPWAVVPLVGAVLLAQRRRRRR